MHAQVLASAVGKEPKQDLLPFGCLVLQSLAARLWSAGATKVGSYSYSCQIPSHATSFLVRCGKVSQNYVMQVIT